MKLVSVENILKAIKDNGYEHYRGGWFKKNYAEEIVGACLLGQAALNLSIDNVGVVKVLNSIRLSREDAAYLESLVKMWSMIDHVHSAGCDRVNENEETYENTANLADVLITLNDASDLSYSELVQIADNVLSKYPEVQVEVRSMFYEVQSSNV